MDETQQKPVPWWERALAIYCVFHFSEGLWGSILADPESLDGSPLLRALWYPIYLFGVFGLIRAGRETLRTFFASPAHVFLLLLAFASTFWSVSPDVTFRRAFALAMTSGFGIYLAARYDWKNMIGVIGGGFVVMAIAGLLAPFVYPKLGIMSEIHVGAWRGVWVEKNYFGALMARGFLICTCASMLFVDRKWFWRGFALLSAFLVIMSTSKTSLLALIIAAATLALIAVVRRGATHALTFGYSILVIALGFGASLLFASDAFFAMLGRDATLTGRTDIWAFVQTAIDERPLFGHGYGAFWQEERGPAYFIRQALQWMVPNAHNGWLDLALGLGYFGMCVAAFYFLTMLLRAFGQFRRVAVGPFAIGMSLLFLLFSMSESSIAQQNSLPWVLLVAIASRLAADAALRRQAAAHRAVERSPQRRRAVAPPPFDDSGGEPISR